MTCAQRLLRVLCLVALCWAPWAAQDARAQAVLDGPVERVDLWPHARMLVDAPGALAFQDVAAMRERFAAPKGAYATLGMDKEVVWLRMPISVAPGGGGLWILDIDYALLRHVDVHVVLDGKLAKQASLGDDGGFASRPMKGRSHALALELPDGASGEIFLRIDTPGAKIVPLTMSRLASFHERALGEQLLQGAFACLGAFLLLFSLGQWLSLREQLYLKYILLVLCSVTFSVHFFGIGEMYLWTDFTWAQRHLAGITALMAAAATALFVEDALASDLRPWLRTGLRAVAIIHVLATLAYGTDVIDIQTVAVLMSTTGLAPALMGLPGAIAKARRGDTVGAWFMAAWLGYFVASAIMVGVVRGRIGANFWTLHSFQIGTTLDMLVFLRIALLRTASRHHDAQRAARERDTLHSLAHSDPLTQLLNRRGLDDALAGALSRAAPGRSLGLYVLDLDGFKPVNDQFGHDAGDELLRTVALRLRGSVRADDAVARVGGDEFVVMAEGLGSEALAADLGHKLLEAFRSPFAFGNERYSVRATIGYVLAPTDAGDANALLKAADKAMYAGKQQGKNRLVRG